MTALTRAEFMRFLRKHNACEPAMTWIRKQRGMTPRELWEAAPVYGWLDWLADYGCGLNFATDGALVAADDAYWATRAEAADNADAATAAEVAEYRRHIKWRDVERAIVRKIRAGKKRERSAA